MNKDFEPYYAVIFTSIFKAEEKESYRKMAALMEELASQQKGFMGVESARTEVGITVSYWENLESIRRWKQNLKHLEAQKLGKEMWYKDYTIRIAKVEMEYSMN